ncbi:hypothetical protein ABW19_dt0206387 [Dactylella cylindrospora]|nr:hypothetical protein ABW19_dt0206387 [Dactylella cylindrospora]
MIDWNGGIADYLSHPTVRKTYTKEDVERIFNHTHLYTSNPPVAHASVKSKEIKPRQNTSPGHGDNRIANIEIEPQTQDNKPTVVKSIVKLSDVNNDDLALKESKVVPRFDCFGNGVWAEFAKLRESAYAFCYIFDAHLYMFLVQDSVRDIREFSLGTVYEAVNVNKPRGLRINFQFTYAPYSWTDTAHWYPMSVFTGIQGFCHKFLISYLTPATEPGCKGKAEVPDTQGGWCGFNAGGTEGDQWFARWSVDPYVPGDKAEQWPHKYPDWEKNNGLPGTDPRDI